MSYEQKIVDECPCCNFGPVLATRYENVRTRIGGGGEGIQVTRWYCDLCAGTITSRRDEFCHENADILKTICYVGNVILARLEEER